MIFGGGQVLIPLLFTELVEFKALLTSEEFISGYALVQAVPGPTFFFCSLLGCIDYVRMGYRRTNCGWFTGRMGIFLPGTFLIFFVSKFWEDVKRYRVIKASLEGINAVSSGLVIAATLYLLEPIPVTQTNYALIFITLIVLFFTKVPTPFVILAGLAMGFIIS